MDDGDNDDNNMDGDNNVDRNGKGNDIGPCVHSVDPYDRSVDPCRHDIVYQ